jgi:heme exporter protein D
MYGIQQHQNETNNTIIDNVCIVAYAKQSPLSSSSSKPCALFRRGVCVTFNVAQSDSFLNAGKYSNMCWSSFTSSSQLSCFVLLFKVVLHRHEENLELLFVRSSTMEFFSMEGFPFWPPLRFWSFSYGYFVIDIATSAMGKGHHRYTANAIQLNSTPLLPSTRGFVGGKA